MIQSILLNGLVIEPRAIASFPLDTTDHAKLRFTATCHMIATLFQLDRGTTIVASLPSFFLGDFDKLLGGVVSRARAASMPTAIAGYAHFGSTSPAFTVFSSRIGSATGVNVNACGLDPLTTATSRTVQTVFGGVLLVLLVPFHLELEIKKFVYVFKGDVFWGAAFGGHMLWVGD